VGHTQDCIGSRICPLSSESARINDADAYGEGSLATSLSYDGGYLRDGVPVPDFLRFSSVGLYASRLVCQATAVIVGHRKLVFVVLCRFTRRVNEVSFNNHVRYECRHISDIA
jgi:hypothetical protein